MRSVGQAGSFGLVFRSQTAKNHNGRYIFRIRPAGLFHLVIWSQNQINDTILISWTDSPAINTGETLHLLQLIAQEPQITLLANGQQLESVVDDVPDQGPVGVGAYQEGPVAASNLKVQTLPYPLGSRNRAKCGRNPRKRAEPAFFRGFR